MRYQTVWRILHGKYIEVEEELNRLQGKSYRGYLQIERIHDCSGSDSITVTLNYRSERSGE